MRAEEICPSFFLGQGLPNHTRFWPLARHPAALTFTLDTEFLIKSSQLQEGGGRAEGGS